mmetsp:Transcript_10630/g.14560  ORF Transcript_10630/g.14560 Transcript_10630/m.14560 type:complete len:233 (-) Transcript_10630:112-810(-)
MKNQGILLEFFEVAVHCILYARNVYPQEIFERRRKYCVPVPMSRSKILNEYISEVLLSLQPWIEKDALERFGIVILGKTNVILERFIFEVESSSAEVDYNNEDIEAALRAFFLRINNCDSFLNPISHQDLSFRFVAYVNTKNPSVDSQVKESLDWIIAEDNKNRLEAFEIDEPVIIPLKSITSDLFKMQLYVEDNPFSRLQQKLAAKMPDNEKWEKSQNDLHSEPSPSGQDE